MSDSSPQSPSPRRGLPRQAAAPTDAVTVDTPVSAVPPTSREPASSPVKKIVMTVIIIALCFGGLVAAASWFRVTAAGNDFLLTYPGSSSLPAWAPVGVPGWLAWQHVLNVFLMVLIIRTGWLVRTVQRPPAYWTRNNLGLIKTKGAPQKVSIHLWLHLSLDAFWFLNGVIFAILLFSTGQWVRIVPTDWSIFPNAVSAGIQYLSFHWPTDNGWVNYNALQVLAYFVTVFLAAPLAALTGIRLSGAWPAESRLSRVFPIETARAIHLPVMFYFVLFIIVHVALVFATGAQSNLNHMYAASDSSSSWLGPIFFGVSVAIIVGAWLAVRPLVLRPLASLTGKVTRQ